MMKKSQQVEPAICQFELSQLNPAEYNPRCISDEAFAGLTESIRKFGCVEPIVVNIRNKTNVIVGGHQRFKVLVELYGNGHVCTCVSVDLSKTDEKLLNLSLNNPKLQGQFIEELAEYIDRLRKSLPNDENYINLKIDQLRDELGDVEHMGLTCEDDIPEPPKKAVTKSGDLWLLGDHRLLCGDSTDEKDVIRLMCDQKASLFATDPPYCVDYTGADRPGGGHDWSDCYHEVDIQDARKFMLDFFKVGLKFIKPKTAIYLWHASRRVPMIHQVCNELGILIHQPIIWVKPCVILTYSVYSWRHEPCFLMWKRGYQPKFRPKDKVISSVWPLGYIRSGDPNTPEYYTDVWELDWEGKKRNPGIEHPTVKPVECFAIPMRVHTSPGAICYEPFCGSGSQIIAAAKLDRKCFAMEKEPIFCDVTVERWQQWTGEKAKCKRK